MGLKKFKASKKTVVPAAQEQTYDSWRVARININGNNLSLHATLQKGREDENGDWESSTLPQDNVQLKINKEELESNKNLESAINSLVTCLEQCAISKKLA